MRGRPRGVAVVCLSVGAWARGAFRTAVLLDRTQWSTPILHEFGADAPCHLALISDHSIMFIYLYNPATAVFSPYTPLPRATPSPTPWFRPADLRGVGHVARAASAPTNLPPLPPTPAGEASASFAAANFSGFGRSLTIPESPRHDCGGGTYTLSSRGRDVSSQYGGRDETCPVSTGEGRDVSSQYGREGRDVSSQYREGRAGGTPCRARRSTPGLCRTAPCRPCATGSSRARRRASPAAGTGATPARSHRERARRQARRRRSRCSRAPRAPPLPHTSGIRAASRPTSRGRRSSFRTLARSGRM
jgi:hypothetical protein